MNQFRRHPDLMNLVDELNLAHLANKLLVDEWDRTYKWVNKYGNFQLNHGYNHLDVTDSDTGNGMNVARCHMRPQKFTPGLDNDENMEATLV